MAMAEAVQQLSKQISNFLFAQRQPCAWRQSKQQTQQQHRNSNARKTEQLNRKGEREYKKINELARAKLQQIQVARKQQVQEKLQQIMITAMRSRGEAGTEEQNGRNRSKKSLIALKMS